MNELVAVNVWTDAQIKLIQDSCCRGSTPDEFKLFLYIARKTGLDPLAKQIYSVPRWDGKLNKEVRTTQTGVDGFRVVAERSGLYSGQLGPYWCGEDGKWVDVWLDKTKSPSAAKVGVLRKDFKEPLYAVANWESYCQKSKEGKPTKFWRDMGPLMLGKVAEVLALRKAFPQDLSSVYSTEEMGQADNDLPGKQNLDFKPSHHELPKQNIPIEKVVSHGAIQPAGLDLGESFFIGGKYDGKKFVEINSDELINYYDYIETKFREDKKPLPEIIKTLGQYLNDLGI